RRPARSSSSAPARRPSRSTRSTRSSKKGSRPCSSRILRWPSAFGDFAHSTRSGATKPSCLGKLLGQKREDDRVPARAVPVLEGGTQDALALEACFLGDPLRGEVLRVGEQLEPF